MATKEEMLNLIEEYAKSLSAYSAEGSYEYDCGPRPYQVKTRIVNALGFTKEDFRWNAKGHISFTDEEMKLVSDLNWDNVNEGDA